MRLLNAHSLKLELFHDSDVQNIQYATLSHTWGEDEVSFDNMEDPAAAEKKLGFAKIRSACETTVSYGLDYVWVDTCCIDKSSSAELSEAINSMFRWYKDSAFCFAYLSDLPPSQTVDQSALEECRWFTRGWTLQELIAPKDLVFFDQTWNRIGTKTGLKFEVENITDINHQILDGSRPLSSVAIAKRMSWASHRKTTRVEDEAYSLLGIFDINMPMIYGEGPRAFTRLQEEILRTTTDLSIFAWRAFDNLNSYRGIFAESPIEFMLCDTIELSQDQFQFRDEISLTNRGIKIHTAVTRIGPNIFMLDLHCYDLMSETSSENLSIYLARDLGTFYRLFPWLLFTGLPVAADAPETIYLARTMTDKILKSLSESRELRINFSLDDALAGHCTVENILAVPELYWDQRRQCFSLPGLSNLLGFVRFCIAPDDTAPTSVLLVFNLASHLELRLALCEENQFQSGCGDRHWQKAINPFTNIEDYGILGDRFSLNAICPGEREVGSRSATISLRDFRLRADLDESNAPHLKINVHIEVLGTPCVDATG
ncbi:unnamed protein product [Clonostachys rhizophaga]|uniref:Heterokaryon incompatibility domain-containing protein n=1 Tax=Clonostachys rhizophaga TaxID=160324 RepID=A0A9N9YFS7_9HYPO|nr:unnamed protein product [Clonostachys rhizophaga]